MGRIQCLKRRDSRGDLFNRDRLLVSGRDVLDLDEALSLFRATIEEHVGDFALYGIIKLLFDLRRFGIKLNMQALLTQLGGQLIGRCSVFFTQMEHERTGTSR